MIWKMTEAILLGPSLHVEESILANVFFHFKHQGDFFTPTSSPKSLVSYGKDSQHIYKRFPLAVFKPKNIDVIPPFIQACAAERIPVTPRCGGTGLTGGALAAQKGIILLTGHLKEIQDLDSHQGTLWAEAGATPNEIEQFLKDTGWCLSFTMEATGTAGLAGCLSTNARPYDGDRRASIVNKISTVEFVDGTGTLREIPAAFVCEAEGIFGVITRLKVHLDRKGSQKIILGISNTHKQILDQFEELKQHRAIKSLIWKPKNLQTPFQMILEEQPWRVEAALQFIQKHFISKSEPAVSPLNQHGIPKEHSYYTLCSSLPLKQLSNGIEYLSSLCLNLGLTCIPSVQLLDGRIFGLIHGPFDERTFASLMEQFFVAWTNVLDLLGGTIASSHGIGSLFPPFMSAFFQEGDIVFLQKTKDQFDPYSICAKNNLLPTAGKCLEKVRDYGRI